MSRAGDRLMSAMYESGSRSIATDDGAALQAELESRPPCCQDFLRARKALAIRRKWPAVFLDVCPQHRDWKQVGRFEAPRGQTSGEAEAA